MVRIIAIGILMFIFPNLNAQNEKKFVREGNQLYIKQKYSDAEVSYRKALEKQSNSQIASYNLGNALYKENKLQEAADQYSHLASDGQLNKNQLSLVYHNLGNSMLLSQKYQESIDAYKKSLRNYPNDMQTKYNLSYAQHMLKNPPKQQNQQNQQDNKNNQDKNQKNDKQQDKKDSKQQQEPMAGKLSKEDAKRMLEAIQNDEKNLQEKLKKEKEMGKKVKPEVDW